MSPQELNKKSTDDGPQKARSFWKRGYDRFLKIRGQPREIALGLAVGIFVAMSPTMGLQMAIAIFLAGLFKWNKISAALGVWVTNPLTAPFIYGITYLVGASFIHIPITQSVPAELTTTKIVLLLSKAPEIMWALTIGGGIVGLPLAVLTYFFAFSALERYQDEIKEKLARSKSRLREKKLLRRQDSHRSRSAPGTAGSPDRILKDQGE